METGSPANNLENKKRVNKIKVEGLDYSLETESYDFEYPEKIQKETGIVGYERTVISPKSLMDLFNHVLKERFNTSLEEKGFDDLPKLTSYLYNTVEGRSMRLEVNQIFEKNVLSSLSNEDYPKKTFNHIYSWHSNEEGKDRHKNDFIKSNFFLEKIYDLEKVKKEKNYVKYPFSNAITVNNDSSEKHANITVYEQGTDKKLSEGDYIPLGEVTEFESLLKTEKAYAATTYGGLNVSQRHFFNKEINFEKDIGFGFSCKLDSFMREYYEKVFLHLAEKNLSESGSWKPNHTLQNVVCSLLLDKMVHDEITSLDDGVELTVGRGQVVLNPTIKEYIKNEGIRFLSSIISKHNPKMDLSNHPMLQFDNICDLFKDISYQSKMPIFIGHKEIPQLSWGNATYANFMSEKGFNFLEFQHAEHLPSKTP